MHERPQWDSDLVQIESDEQLNKVPRLQSCCSFQAIMFEVGKKALGI